MSIAESIYEKLGFKDEIEKNKKQISKIKISKPFIAFLLITKVVQHQECIYTKKNYPLIIIVHVAYHLD